MWKQRLLFFTAAGMILLCCQTRDVVPTDSSAEITGQNRYIALTFDDGPKEGTTDRLLDGLRERGASATFFLLGEEAQKFPKLVQRMQTEGHQIGNHTWDHVRLENVSEAVFLDEVGRTEALLASLLGTDGFWLRPPYGAVDQKLEHLVTVPMVKWSVDPRDWESRNTQKIVQAVLENAKPNSVILLHDIYPTSVAAALEIVDKLQAEGYWFVTVEELLQLNGITPEPGKLYRNG